MYIIYTEIRWLTTSTTCVGLAPLGKRQVSLRNVDGIWQILQPVITSTVLPTTYLILYNKRKLLGICSTSEVLEIM